MSRYDDLPKMSREDLEAELTFYEWLEENKKEMDTSIIENKIWLDALWTEVKRRGYDYEKKIVLIDNENNWELLTNKIMFAYKNNLN